MKKLIGLLAIVLLFSSCYKNYRAKQVFYSYSSYRYITSNIIEVIEVHGKGYRVGDTIQKLGSEYILLEEVK